MKFKGILFALAGALIFTGLNDTVNAAAPAAPKKYDARTTTNKINALINISAAKVTFDRIPEREELDPELKEQLVIEYYSK